MPARIYYLSMLVATWLMLIAAIGTPAIAVAADESTPSPTESAAVKPAPSKMICKKEKVVGTNIRRKTCRTQAQNDAIREASQEALRQINSRSGVVVKSGG